MKAAKYHIAKGTNSRGKPRADTMARVEIDERWTWFTGFADETSAIDFVHELCGANATAS